MKKKKKKSAVTHASQQCDTSLKEPCWAGHQLAAATATAGTLPAPAGASWASCSSFFLERGERQELTAQAGHCHGPQTLRLSKGIHGD